MFQIALDTTYWTVFNHITIWGSLVTYFVLDYFYNYVIGGPYVGSLTVALTQATFWFTAVLTVSTPVRTHHTAYRLTALPLPRAYYEHNKFIISYSYIKILSECLFIALSIVRFFSFRYFVPFCRFSLSFLFLNMLDYF